MLMWLTRWVNSKGGVPKLDFDRRLKLEFRGSRVASGAELLPYRELGVAVGLTEIAETCSRTPVVGRSVALGLSGSPTNPFSDALAGMAT